MKNVLVIIVYSVFTMGLYKYYPTLAIGFLAYTIAVCYYELKAQDS